MRRLVWCPLVLLLTGCSSPTTPSTTTANVTTTTDVFSGVLEVGGSRFHTFTSAGSSTAAATLGTVMTRSGTVLTTPVTLALGVASDAGETCTDSIATAARGALTSQVSLSVGAGAYCVKVTDAGGLTETVVYTVRVVHP